MGIRRREKREKEKEKVGFTVGGCRASSIDNEQFSSVVASRGGWVGGEKKGRKREHVTWNKRCEKDATSR